MADDAHQFRLSTTKPRPAGLWRNQVRAKRDGRPSRAGRWARVAAIVLLLANSGAAKKKPVELTLRLTGYYTPESSHVAMQRVFVMQGSDDKQYVLACSLKTQPPCPFFEVGQRFEARRDPELVKARYQDKKGVEHKQDFSILRVRDTGSGDDEE